ncbi:hypothetical protein AVEN_53867-1 [Araneus ventricosus]|uniref:Uncharacterized protein n=1 Tax=Araneus ventricosus TaxID=182803 RepID=A0A4Y2BA32_ARAVE|nr:hypothetical protein AVEN_53867-1 [Araneus ventricosus]
MLAYSAAWSSLQILWDEVSPRAGMQVVDGNVRVKVRSLHLLGAVVRPGMLQVVSQVQCQAQGFHYICSPNGDKVGLIKVWE